MRKMVAVGLLALVFLALAVPVLAASTSATISIDGLVGKAWRRGTGSMMRLTLTSDQPVVFIGQRFSSGCGIQGLPGGFVSSQTSEVTFSWWTYLPEDAHPGRCTITGSYYIWGNPSVVYQVKYWFVVKK